MTYRLGLTGSIGMGKSTTAAMFAEAGIPVWDADSAVHRIYSRDGAGAQALAGVVPEAIRSGEVDRSALRQAILDDDSLLTKIERVIHPIVGQDRATFLAAHADCSLVVLDIPLLFETGAGAGLDGTLVVSAPASVQRERVLARPGMTRDAFATILARQMPDAEKRRRAEFVIETDRGLEAARADVLSLITRLEAEAGHA